MTTVHTQEGAEGVVSGAVEEEEVGEGDEVVRTTPTSLTCPSSNGRVVSTMFVPFDISSHQTLFKTTHLLHPQTTEPAHLEAEVEVGARDLPPRSMFSSTRNEVSVLPAEGVKGEGMTEIPPFYHMGAVAT